MPDLSLTPDQRANLARLLREAIEADRHPLSPRVRRLKALLAKVNSAPAPVAVPLPAEAAGSSELGAGEEAAAVDSICARIP